MISNLPADNMILTRLAFAFGWAAMCFLAAESSFAADQEGAPSVLMSALQQNCVKCHGKAGKPKGKVNLFKLKAEADLTNNPELLKDMIDALDLKEMPPEKAPPLKPVTRRQMIAQLTKLLHGAANARVGLSRAPIRRMNRFQYHNAVTDLFDLKVAVFQLPERMLREHRNYFQPATGKMPNNVTAGSRALGKSQLIEPRLAGVTPFPQDLRAEHGFDNRGDHLSLSPLLMESFINLSRSIVESPDFQAKNCRIWPAFFAPPPDSKQYDVEVKKRLRNFLTRAFRRPVDEKLLGRYTVHVLAKIKDGEAFEDGMKSAASAAIASPRFLYVYDRVSSGKTSEPLDDFELASRLSFFLWGSIPDQTLLDVAAAGKLHEPEVLIEQVDRMLKDRKLKRFCDSFPSQWLQLERIISSVPDPKLHPNFYFLRYRASMHMMLEPLLVFETILIENRSILDLIDPDFSYRSKLLDGWYSGGKRAAGSPTGIAFRRVKIADRRQGGMITNAAVMTMTSGPMRTKPITRGAWIATVIFNDPPEPPPADVPPLSQGEDKGAEKTLTLRERLSAHRERQDCAGCHEKIDPLGFALENYGPTGIWREKYENGRDVDASGVLFRKHKFSNIIEFKDAILAEKDRFTRGFAAHLLSFALGREVNASDAATLDYIASETKAADYKMQALIRQITLSKPFLHKYNPKEGKSDNGK